MCALCDMQDNTFNDNDLLLMSVLSMKLTMDILMHTPVVKQGIIVTFLLQVGQFVYMYLHSL